MKNYYTILNVDENADEGTIKKAYRKLQMKYHPDKKGGNSEKAKEVNEAYDCLGDKDKKKQYDMQRKGIPFGGMHGMGGGMDDVFNMFFNQGDPFNHISMMQQAMHGQSMGGHPNIRIFRNGRPVHVNQKPPEINKTLNISLKDAYNGKSVPISIERWIQQNNNRRTENETLYVPINQGIDNNEIIIIKGKGNVLNTNRGDIKIHIKITNKSHFKRNGLDLIFEKKLSLKEALTGFSFELKLLSEKTLNINNAGDYIIEPNNHQMVNNYGMKRNNKVGNLIISFKVEFPKTLSNDQKNKLKKIL